MNRDRHAPLEHAQPDHPSDRDDKLQVRKDRSQGIVRDERGQEQPADKERAQRVSQSE